MDLKENLIASPKVVKQERLAWSGLQTYSCYCCHDTGYVVRIERVLQTHHLFSRPILCKRIGCTAAIQVQTNPKIVDTRLTPEECKELHDWGKQDWSESEANWHLSRQQQRIQKMTEQATQGVDSKP